MSWWFDLLWFSALSVTTILWYCQVHENRAINERLEILDAKIQDASDEANKD